MRKEKIERVFADAKEKHAMRYTPYRGLTQVTNWAKLKFACLNLKKLALWKSKDNHNTNKYPIFTHFFIAISKNYNSFKQNPIQAFARIGFIYSLACSIVYNRTGFYIKYDNFSSMIHIDEILYCYGR